MQRPSTQVSARIFFLLTFFLSWLVWIPLVLSRFGVGPFQIPDEISSIVRLLGVLMPATSAVILTVLGGGSAAIRRLFGRLLIWRVGLRWWAAAVVVQPALLLLSAGIFNLLGGTPPVSATAIGSVSAFVINIVFLGLASLGEEIGWRGVALPSLQESQSALRSSVILGVLWATWHVPFWLLLDTFDQYGLGYVVLNFLLIVPSTMYITWFFNHGRYSLMLPVAFHLAFNTLNAAWLPVTTNIGAFGLLIAFEWILTLVVYRHLESPSRIDGLTSPASPVRCV